MTSAATTPAILAATVALHAVSNPALTVVEKAVPLRSTVSATEPVKVVATAATPVADGPVVGKLPSAAA